jgi:iron complex outermembrane receptor protein
MLNMNAARAGWRARGLLAAGCSTGALVLAASLMAGQALAADASNGTPDAPQAAPASPDAAVPDYGTRVSELVVTAPEGGAVEAAPVKAPLQSTEPTSIIPHTTIDQYVPQTGDFSQVILLAPSVSGISQNGPGFYEAKSTLRGFSDGQYNVTYDGIPFGDTNDFTHHSTSFFPASNIGAASVERGPGEAGQLGEATFGGSVNLFSPEVSDSFGASEQLTYGSWNTAQSVAKLNTGDIAALHDTHILVALQDASTAGYLTHSDAYGLNEMIRSVTPLVGNWTLTLFSTVNFTFLHEDDNNGATRAQVAEFGKSFALTGSQFFDDGSQAGLIAALNPKTGIPLTTPAVSAWPGTWVKYNSVKKATDFEYARLAGDVSATLHLEDTFYTYAYTNNTISAQDVTGAALVATHLNPTNLSALTIGDVPGYTKLNNYRVEGDILRLNFDLPFGALKTGAWVEHADTHRSRLDYDLTAGLAAGNLTSVPDYHDPTSTQTPAQTAPANVLYNQNSTFDTVQPFVDLVWNVSPQLTFTPGVKFVDFWRAADGPFNQGTRNSVRQDDNQSKLLYFATINYRLMQNWSVYGQYATGLLQAPLSVLQSSGANTAALKPQETTNYQVGTVFQNTRFTIDADFYLIQFNNLLSSFTGTSTFSGLVCPVNETCFENIAGATYKGVEGDATYAVTPELFAFVNGSWNSAKNQMTGLQISGAPAYTFAAGGIWRHDGWSVSLNDKLVGDNHEVDAKCATGTGILNVPCVVTNLASYEFYKLGAYNELDLSIVKTISHLRLEAGVYNLLDSQQAYQIKPNSKSATSLANPSTQFDQMYFQTPINFQLSARYTF